ncbi:hypothetical protein [Allokutzneria oryzae]|uniref:DUF2867 domain-containing protein n=1 Tax=Allokutzneria oryzae TaxID=1378989 RepID=A0ABV5ZTD4_9PSEU
MPPLVDEHAITITAGTGTVWRALGEALDRTFSPMAVYTRLIGCTDRTASGPRPPVEGSTFPGFRVTSAVPGTELVLQGRHRFSTYALTFRLDQLGPGRSRLRAESRAAFPGPLGRCYRFLVIGTGGHVLAVRRLLSRVAARAER